MTMIFSFIFTLPLVIQIWKRPLPFFNLHRTHKRKATSERGLKLQQLGTIIGSAPTVVSATSRSLTTDTMIFRRDDLNDFSHG